MFWLMIMLSSMSVSTMPLKGTINHPVHILIRIASLKHQLKVRASNEFSEKYSEKSFLKIWNQRHMHIKCNQLICLENQLSGFLF